MDPSLQAHVKLDVVSDVVRIDVRGNLTQASRPALLQIIQRVRRGGITSHISVDLGRAAFVESSALAGLRNDLNSIHGAGAGGSVAGMPAPGGVSLELTPHGDDDLAALPTLDMSTELLASVDPAGAGQLALLSDEELLAASDSLFGLLDDPTDMARSELLATYDAIALEISRREMGRDTEPV